MDNEIRPFDLTPDPKVLITLTHTPMQPLDALCELIDNSIDSFRAAKLQGCPVDRPFVALDLPRVGEVNYGTGLVRIRDNGPGLSIEMAEKAVKAGFSGNNSYDTLGLFGMGFNISTGKMGSFTRFITAREENDYYIEVPIDLESINKNKSYQVEIKKAQKNPEFTHGTITEVSNWWPEGNPNRGFIKRLAHYGPKKIREQLGRRYATILRQKDVRIIVNGKECNPFEHCVWDHSRYVERRGWGRIPAVFDFDEVVGAHRRCYKCTTLIDGNANECPSCGSKDIRTVEERIKGWVGIQRFDSRTEYGIDLIRNGRAIRIGEKTAFFDYTDEFGKTEKDYPIDSSFGRIVGEVELNHVPVDYMKQDFQRSSSEWQHAMSFLRGDSSLQPSKPGAENNHSPIFKLYQGYRRVSTAGKTDLYMGYWDDNKQKPARISRDVEAAFYEKFLAHEKGYYDDAEWWKKVEEADTKPVKALKTCPECGSQHLDEEEVCSVCGFVFKGKECINPECGRKIPFSAKICQFCGKSQIPIVEEQWTCEVCGTKNSALHDVCRECGSIKGTRNHLDKDYLIDNSNKDDSLSISSCSIELADGSTSSPLNVEVYVTKDSITPNMSQEKLPVFTIKDTFDHLSIFIDKGHPIFKTNGTTPESVVSYEIASMIFDLNRRLVSYAGVHSVSNIANQVLSKYWLDDIDGGSEKLLSNIRDCLNNIKEKLAENVSDSAQSLYDEMSQEQTKEMIDNMLSLGINISNLGTMIQSGEYIKFVGADFIGNAFDQMPELFFDYRIWDVPYFNIHEMEDGLKKYAQGRTIQVYKNCLDDIIQFEKYKFQDEISVARTKLSLKFLLRKVVD